ncbi:MAG: hypothetical protein AAF694_13585 [Bacteroidota bacterium]
MRIIIHDETQSGCILNQVKLKVSKNRITIKELIKLRIFQEAEEFNARRSSHYRGLVRPDHAVPMLSGFQLDPSYRIDPQKQYYVAMDAFKRQGFYVLVDEERIEDPDYAIAVRSCPRISFLKLVPVIGG